MPTLRYPTDQELEEFRQQGVDVDAIKGQKLLFHDDVSIPQAIGRTLSAEKGGIVGGGVGAIGGAALAEELLGAPLAPFTGGASLAIAPIVGGALGAFGGGALGQKAQQKIEGDEEFQREQALAQQAREQHPIVSAATGIGASALASGGWPSIATPLRAGRGIVNKLMGTELSGLTASDAAILRDLGSSELSPAGTKIMEQAIGDSAAAKNVAIQSVVNPALMSGINVATTGQLPSLSELGQQALGGALFAGRGPVSKVAESIVGKIKGGGEKQQEPKQYGDITDVSPPELTPNPTLQSPFKEKTPAGDYKIDDSSVKQAFQAANPKPSKDAYTTDTDFYKANTEWKRLMKTPVDEMRSSLDSAWVTKASTSGQAAPEPTIKIPDQVVKPAATTSDIIPPVTKSEVGPADRLPTVDELTKAVTEAFQKKQREEDYQKAKDELARQEALIKNIPVEGGTRPIEASQILVENLTKPLLAPNSVRISANENLVKNDINRPESFDRSKFARLSGLYGHWIRPDGSMIEIRGGDSHESKAIEILKELVKTGQMSQEEYDKLNIPLNSTSDIENALYKRGYLRGIYNGPDEYIANSYNSNGNLKQKASLKNFGIETNTKMLYVPTEGSRSNEIIFDPEDSSKFAQKTTIPVGEGKEQGNLVGETTVAKGIAGMTEDNPAGQLLKGINFDKATLNTRLIVSHFVNRPTYRVTQEHPEGIIIVPPGTDDNAIAHEIGHAATLHKLPEAWEYAKGADLKSLMDDYLVRGTNENIKEIVRCYYKAAQDFGIHDILFGKEISPDNRQGGLASSKTEHADVLGRSITHGYAMSNIHEFINNVFDNKAFTEHLNNLDSGLNNGKSLLSRLYDAVRNLFGLDAKHGSLLERLMKPVEALMEENRPSTKLENAYSEKGARKRAKDEPITLRATSSAIDKIRQVDHPAAKQTADKFQMALDEAPHLLGQTWNKIMQTAQKIGLSGKDKEQLAKISYWENVNHAPAPSSMFQNPRQKAMYDMERKVYSDFGDERIKRGEPVYRGNTPTILKKDPYSHPTTPDPRVVEVYKRNEDQPLIQKYDKAYYDAAIAQGYTPKEAQESLENWRIAMQGSMNQQGGNMVRYNAIRRAQGVSLPPELARKDYLQNLEVYYNRGAKDVSFYTNVEKDPKVMAALGATRDAWQKPIPPDPTGGIAGNHDVRSVIDEFRGDISSMSSHNEKALSSLAAMTFISSPGLQVHKLLSNLAGVGSYVDNPYQHLKVLGKAIANMKEGYQHAVEEGTQKLTSRSMLDMMDGNKTASEKMQALAHTISQVSSAGGLTDKWTNALMQSAFEQIVPSKIGKANGGDLNAHMLMKKWDPSYTVGKTYTPQEQQFLAAKAAGYIHGTGDARTMPAWMLNDSEISGFFKLAHWSIAQTNRFMSDVLTPATKGSYGPLLNSLFGAAIGGYMIKELREKLMGKHGQIPSLQEIASSSQGLSGNKGILAYNMIAGLQYAGFAGLLSQAAKYPFDFIYKNHPQGATFPMDEVATDLGQTIGQVTTAIANDPNVNWGSLAAAVANHVWTTNVQLSRMAFNQGVNAGLITGLPAEKKLLADKMGELRRFNMVEGLPYVEQDSAGNPYMNLEQKKFKHEQDIGEAVKQLPQLVSNIIDTYHDKPDVMMSKLKALKENQYATFPSLETMPLSYLKYMGYLNRLKGPEEASNALMDYMKHKVINQAKGSMVP